MKPEQDSKCPEKTSLENIETKDEKTTAKDLNDESDRAGQIEETDVQSPRRITKNKCMEAIILTSISIIF